VGKLDRKSSLVSFLFPKQNGYIGSYAINLDHNKHQLFLFHSEATAETESDRIGDGFHA
jgi:hypothetical protein